MMKMSGFKISICIAAVVSLLITTPSRAETNILEAAAPNGWVFQYFNIDQHASNFAAEDMPVTDMKVDANISLFRAAYWDTNYVLHTIIPYGYINQEMSVANTEVSDGYSDGLGDMYIGGAYRWNGENKDSWLLGGMDIMLPTGRYDSSISTPYLGKGSTSFQPFVILSKLYSQGAWGHDTEIRYDIFSDWGEVKHDPDDVLELWQTLHMGVAENLRTGIAFKGEFSCTDDNNDGVNSAYMGVGPEIMWNNDKGIVIWAKLLFDTYAKDHPEDYTSFTLRLSVPF